MRPLGVRAHLSGDKSDQVTEELSINRADRDPSAHLFFEVDWSGIVATPPLDLIWLEALVLNSVRPSLILCAQHVDSSRWKIHQPLRLLAC